MFPQFGAESLSKASSLVLRIGTDAHLYDDPDDVSIGPLLDSRFDSEKVEALKRLLALIAQGDDVSNFFPQVVKNVASQSLDVKKLVYLYLLHYAEKRQNEALLSINSFQKDLSDTNPLVRALALRAMAGIRLHVVAPLVLAAVSKCARDPSAYVRKCAAHAIPKLHDLLREENNTSLEEIVGILINDQSPGVVGAASAAFKSVCPSSLFLIGKSFRRLCEILPDIEEWGQIVLIEILLRYVVARHGLVKESIMFATELPPDMDMHINDHSMVPSVAFDFNITSLLYRCYVEGHKEYLSLSGNMNVEDDTFHNTPSTSSTNDDVRILLQCTSPLLWSQNSAVVLAAAGVHWIMASSMEVERIIKPLLFTLRSSPASKYVMLCNIIVFAKAVPSFFAPYFEDFFVCRSDSYQIRALKLEILSIIATESSLPIILEEFQDYIRDPDRRFVADTIAAISLCAQRLSVVAYTCLEGLLALVLQESSIGNSCKVDGEAVILVQAIMSIKAIIKRDPISHEKVIIQLVRTLDIVKEPAARALIIWIVGEYSSIGQVIPKIVPSVLKYLARSFTSEEVETKLQIISSTAKILSNGRGEDLMTFRMIFDYIMELAKYDLNYDVRDRARLMSQLMAWNFVSSNLEQKLSSLATNGGESHQLAQTILGGIAYSKKPLTKTFQVYLPGSLSQIVLHGAPGYIPLPEPSSLVDNDISQHDIKETAVQKAKNDSFGMQGPDASSVSSAEESDSMYDSQYSDVVSNNEGTVGDAHATLEINLSDLDGQHSTAVIVSDDRQPTESFKTDISKFISSDLADLMSKSTLDSWLDEQPASTSVQASNQPSSGRISINDLDYAVTPKVHMLLDPTNGNGLRVEYAFSSEVPTVSTKLVCIEIFLENLSSESLLNIILKDEDDSGVESTNHELEESTSLLSENMPSLFSFDEIANLKPGQKVKKEIQAHFNHHLLPLKLALFCNGKKHLTKLWPEIGYFLKPLPMTWEAFLVKERQLPGMFEYSKRCSFRDHIDKLDSEKDHNSLDNDKIIALSRALASKVRSNSNVFLVSVDMPVSFSFEDASGLCLRFSGEILSCGKPCLITIMAEGKLSEALDVTVKINCEETVFGFNLLNRVAAFLQ